MPKNDPDQPPKHALPLRDALEQAMDWWDAWESRRLARDDDVLETARERYRQAGCPPTAVVVTGRHPHPRAQLLWKQEAPVRDADLCRAQNAALARALRPWRARTMPRPRRSRR